MLKPTDWTFDHDSRTIIVDPTGRAYVRPSDDNPGLFVAAEVALPCWTFTPKTGVPFAEAVAAVERGVRWQPPSPA
jgi:hypothetical protein